MRAELGPQLLVAAFAEEVQIELADGGQEAVRVLDRDGAGVAVVDLEPVAQRQLGAVDHAFEDPAGMHAFQLGGLAAGEQGANAGGGRPEAADDGPALGRVGTEHAMRIGVLAADDPLEIFGGGDGHTGSVPTRGVSCG
jgi:hypothetical protein